MSRATRSARRLDPASWPRRASRPGQAVLPSILLLCAAVPAAELADAVARVSPSVVNVDVDKLRRSPGNSSGGSLVQVRSVGSGFLFRAPGYILTCNHVIADYEEIAIELPDGTRFSGDDVRVVGRDVVTDLAVLAVSSEEALPVARMGNSDSLRVGDPVVAVGTPYGLQGSATAGVVSGLGRWGLQKSSGPDFQDFIQTDALINPGNSGGPLADASGRVIGINSFARTARGNMTGIGFATPINLALRVADELVARGEVVRGYAGISTQPVTELIARSLGFVPASGALVSSVRPGGPGASAGLNPGDIVFALDDSPVADVRRFQEELSARRPGDTVRLSVFRRGDTLDLVVGLGAWPTRDIEPRDPPPSRAWLGLVVRSLDEAAIARTGVARGVMVDAVEPGSPADEADVNPGDVIVEANLAPVTDLAGYRAIERTMVTYFHPVLFRVVRGRVPFYVAVDPEG